jgi:hypothetical protein
MSEKPPSTNKKTARRRTLCSADRGCGSGYAQSRSLVAAAIGHEANANKAKDHHRPGGGLGDAYDGINGTGYYKSERSTPKNSNT